MTVHLLMNPCAINDCLSLVSPGDRLMLADAGVSLLADRQAMARFGEVGHVEALEVDARVRGLDSNPPARLVSDEEWVQRVVSADRVMSWT